MHALTPPLPGSGLLRRILFGLLAFASVLAPLQAQSSSGSLSGKVNASTGQPLSGVRLQIGELATFTRDDGSFYFGVVPAGPQTVLMRYIGDDAQASEVVVAAGGNTVANLTLDIVLLDAVTVEGQRAGLAEALGLQRAALNLTETIASDAIGRFPDQNAAESLQRMSGVALERDQGEGRFVSIRGLNADLNNTQLNGVNIPSSESDTRKVNLDVISSEMLDGVELTKAVTPDMDGRSRPPSKARRTRRPTASATNTASPGASATWRTASACSSRSATRSVSTTC